MHATDLVKVTIDSVDFMKVGPCARGTVTEVKEIQARVKSRTLSSEISNRAL